jgi:hypothetical protein
MFFGRGSASTQASMRQRFRTARHGIGSEDEPPLPGNTQRLGSKSGPPTMHLAQSTARESKDGAPLEVSVAYGNRCSADQPKVDIINLHYDASPMHEAPATDHSTIPRNLHAVRRVAAVIPLMRASGLVYQQPLGRAAELPSAPRLKKSRAASRPGRDRRLVLVHQRGAVPIPSKPVTNVILADHSAHVSSETIDSP